jgi:hypothetical protein
MSQQNDDKSNWKISGAKALPERVPPPTVWPATVALGVTLLAFGVVTSWIMSLAGLVLFLFGVGGWVEDLRHDQLQ